ncbi:polysaccharide deacetylase family protein [Methylobacterium sp. Leaf399]|uniref:polysaccharide deacetylase family protein n=1 Tax=Methylobacterium sp. Leaf399 TaxID=1736364 RepID=UPI0009E982BD|nr:polysaccharide deacetylase family protein [Methylobacterium sp. Leaf399]
MSERSGVRTPPDRPGTPAGEPLRLRLRRAAARLVRTRTQLVRFSEPLVSFTFDDVLETACTVGAPILEEAGARGTFYCAGHLHDGWTGPALASPDQVVALHRRGHEIGCHTYTHRAVSDLSREALAADLARNRAHFSGLAPDMALSNFAYPFNTTSLRAKRQLERSFATCRAGVPGVNAGRIDLGYLRAVELADGFADRAAIRAWIARAVRERGWLIFFSHGIAQVPEPWGCHPDLLRFAVAEAGTQGARIVPVAEAVRRAAGGTTAEPERAFLS